MLKHLGTLLFSTDCVHCAASLLENERFVCLPCSAQIHLLPHQKTEGEMDALFYGKVEVQRAIALFAFVKGGVSQSLIHHLKYKNKAELGFYFGQQLAAALHLLDLDIDAVVPVPMSWAKRRKRGYNQSEKIAQGIAQYLQLPLLPNYLRRVKQKESQTRYNKYSRWQNIQVAFELNSKAPQHYKHVLLVDDVITTGATMEHCAAAIVAQGSTKVSMAALAFAPALR